MRLTRGRPFDESASEPHSCGSYFSMITNFQPCPAQIKTASMIAVALVGVAALATVALLQSAPREEMTAAKGRTPL